MTENTKTKVVDSQVKVDLPVKIDKPVIRRVLSAEAIANDLTSRITAKLIGWDDLYDPKTQQFLTEAELKAKGAVFVTLGYRKNVTNELLKKDRITKEPNPYTCVIKTSKYQVIANINWQSYINRRSNHGNFEANEKRANGIENYNECKAIGITRQGKHTINGVAFRMLETVKYFDGIGNELKEVELKNYLKTQSKESKQKEADKHGIKVEFDPQYRTTRIDSCESIRAFGFDFNPKENG